MQRNNVGAMKKLITFFKNLIKDMLRLLLIVAGLILGINCYVLIRAEADTVSAEKAGSGYDCILVLGCAVHGDTPSNMLRDRLDTALSLYKAGAAPVILMSGDHDDNYYNEVAVMQQYAVEHGVPTEAILLDHRGFSTYESMYRAEDEFQMTKVLIVTQRYHLYRAVYVANRVGMDATGTEAAPNAYPFRMQNEVREIFARDKDFLFCLFKIAPASAAR